MNEKIYLYDLNNGLTVTSYKDHFKLCFCMKWSPLYEVVFDRNGLCTKGLDTE